MSLLARLPKGLLYITNRAVPGFDDEEKRLETSFQKDKKHEKVIDFILGESVIVIKMFRIRSAQGGWKKRRKSFWSPARRAIETSDPITMPAIAAAPNP